MRKPRRFGAGARGQGDPWLKGKGTRRIVVREQKEIHKGTNNGRDYTIYQVIATTEGGRPHRPEPSELPAAPEEPVIEVTVERFESAQWGVSYTRQHQEERRRRSR
jgi:hypothetical protein